MGKALENNLINLGLLDNMKARAREPRARPRRPARAGARRRARQRRPGAAGRLLPRLDGHAGAARPTATASATSSASSTRRSATAGRWSGPRSGCASATPGRSPRPEYQVPVRLLRPHRAACAGRDGGELRSRWVDTRQRAGHALRHAHRRLPQRHRQHAAAVARPRLAGVRPGRLQRRRLPGARSRTRTSPRTSPRCSTPTTSR